MQWVDFQPKNYLCAQNLEFFMLLFIFLIVPLMIWVLPFSQLKLKPQGARWFLFNFIAMVVTVLGLGFLLWLLEFNAEAVFALGLLVSVLWAMYINSRVHRFDD